LRIEEREREREREREGEREREVKGLNWGLNAHVCQACQIMRDGRGAKERRGEERREEEK